MTKRKTSLSDEWLDRALVVAPYHYCLCLTEKRFHQQMKHCKIHKEQYTDFLINGKTATVHFYEKSDGVKIAFVCVDGSRKTTRPQMYALLTHEAVHIWQYSRKDIGETDPSTEFEAYSIQAIAQRLFESYERQK